MDGSSEGGTSETGSSAGKVNCAGDESRSISRVKPKRSRRCRHRRRSCHPSGKPEQKEVLDLGYAHPASVDAGIRSAIPPIRRIDQSKIAAEIASHSTKDQNWPRFGALDLGTNNCRLLIAEMRERGFRIVDAFSRIVRLGEGISATGQLGELAMERTAEALTICSRKLRQNKVKKARLIATEACRTALNGAEFLSRIKQETGLELEIIDQETEARLAVSGCANLVDRRSDGVVIFDIGGGSTEIIWVDLKGRFPTGPNVRRSIRSWMSLPIGVVTLADKFGGTNVDCSVYEKMKEFIREHLLHFPEADALSSAVGKQHIHLLGTSGTVTTLAGVQLKLPRYDRRKVDGSWLDQKDIWSVTHNLLSMTHEQRAANACIGPQRADLVLGGCAILDAIVSIWPCQHLRVADRGLREGILSDLVASERKSQKRSRRWRNPDRRI